MANQKQRERKANAVDWRCRYCWNERTGERWWISALADSCRRCQRSKGVCYHSPRGVGGPPSISVKEKTAQESLKDTLAELQRLKKELAEAKRQPPLQA